MLTGLVVEFVVEVFLLYTKKTTTSKTTNKTYSLKHKNNKNTEEEKHIGGNSARLNTQRRKTINGGTILMEENTYSIKV